MKLGMFGRFLGVCVCVGALGVGQLGIAEELDMPLASKTPTVEQVLAEMRANSKLYMQPTEQDQANRGLYPKEGEKDFRSESVYPSYVLGPRRQTDSLVRQLHTLMPKSVTDNIAFLIADRVVQYPERYIEEILNKEHVVIIGSFVGTNQILSEDDPDYASRLERHIDEMWKFSMTLNLARSLQKNVKEVFYSMGDTSTEFGNTVRQRLEAEQHRLLIEAGYAHLARPLSWGADDLAPVAFAAMLPEVKVRLQFSNPHAPQHYDGMQEARSLALLKMKELGVSIAKEDEKADFEVAVLTRRPEADTSFQRNDDAQKALDDRFLAQFKNYSPAQQNQLVIVDARTFNGAWDSKAALRSCDLLAYGSWGTFSNVIGTTLAKAKILHFAKNEAARKQLNIEAVAHDVFANGYEEAQRGPLAQLLAPYGIAYNHWYGYETLEETSKVFEVLDAHVRRKTFEYFSGTTCMAGRNIRVTPQLWRTFESEVHLWPVLPGEIFAPGIYRTDLPAIRFSPLL